MTKTVTQDKIIILHHHTCITVAEE